MKSLSLSLLFLFSFAFSAQARLNPRLEDGLALTHPRIVETLSQRSSGEGLGLAYYLDSTGQSKPNLSNLQLSKLPAMATVLSSLKREIDLFTKQNDKPGDTVGVGVNFHHRLFDIRFLEFDRARFVLVGVVNRMDQAFKDPQTCGETRLIYRLAYSVQVNGDSEKTVVSRLPMTLNLILNAKSASSRLTCAEIAQRWKNLNIEGLTITRAVDQIMGLEGPLAPELRDRSLIKRLELNLQLARKAAAVRPDFGGNAVYLLKVYGWNPSAQNFTESTLDNQVDRAKAEEFYAWLFDPVHKQKHLQALDQGTLRIPEKFLAVRAYSIAPGGLSRAVNHPLSGILSDAQIRTQLADLRFENMANIKSIEGFKRRLTDVSCTGCHQSRAIGGFHFIGQDPMRWVEGTSAFSPLYPGNGVVVPGSGHFFADLERRRSIQQQIIADFSSVNYASGFSSRPYGDSEPGGWGSHCSTGDDQSFARWTCASRLKCTALYTSSSAPGIGVCTSASGQEIGDPTESGEISLSGKSWSSDNYRRTEAFGIPRGKEYVNSNQSAQPGEKTGGFPSGSIRLSSCDKTVMDRHPEARCGSLPAASNGFNDCLFDKTMTFKQCLDKYSKGVGLRGCSREKPCRDDYICAEGFVVGEEDAGVCVPPYFTFQFRVDGHPVKF